MTEKEQLQEDIRLLGLKVDELKAQNGHYSQETEELMVKKSDFEKQAQKASEESGLLTSVRDSISKEVDKIKEVLAKRKEDLKKLEEKFAKLNGEFSLLNAENIKGQKKADELKYQTNELETRLANSQREIETKYASLKGFEEQLLIREGLLNKREEMLDLKEKGVEVAK